ncbi:hypothetical protein HN011_001652 [Eciton burchellii]|jgi:hypothetical protein|nr:hypothetical protein HN011_001652 [Eciton burchellii]
MFRSVTFNRLPFVLSWRDRSPDRYFYPFTSPVSRHKISARAEWLIVGQKFQSDKGPISYVSEDFPLARVATIEIEVIVSRNTIVYSQSEPIGSIALKFAQLIRVNLN